MSKFCLINRFVPKEVLVQNLQLEEIVPNGMMSMSLSARIPSLPTRLISRLGDESKRLDAFDEEKITQFIEDYIWIDHHGYRG